MASGSQHTLIQTKNVIKIFTFCNYNFSIEKDPTDNAAKQRDSQDCSQKVRFDISVFIAYVRQQILLFECTGAGTAKTFRKCAQSNSSIARHRLQPRGTTAAAGNPSKSARAQTATHQKVQTHTVLTRQPRRVPAAQMVLRFLLRYFANNEQLVQRMADSYAMRRAAQLVLAAFFKSKNIAAERGLNELTPQKFRAIFDTFRTNLKQEIEGAKEELKRRK